MQSLPVIKQRELQAENVTEWHLVQTKINTLCTLNPMPSHLTHIVHLNPMHTFCILNPMPIHLIHIEPNAHLLICKLYLAGAQLAQGTYVAGRCYLG